MFNMSSCGLNADRETTAPLVNGMVSNAGSQKCDDVCIHLDTVLALD